MRLVRRAAIIGAIVLACPPAAPLAQTSSANSTHWGLRFSAAPRLRMADFLEIITGPETDVNFVVAELAFGIVRGQAGGGEWGVSFVHKPFRDGLAGVEDETRCFIPPGQTVEACNHRLERVFFHGVSLSGVEVHWFIPFLRVGDRVRIGMNVGGGISRSAGQSRVVLDNEKDDSVCDTNPCRIVRVVTHEETVQPASEDLGFDPFPLLKAEAQGAVRVGRAFTLQMAIGLNMPTVNVRVGGVYYFGAK